MKLDVTRVDIWAAGITDRPGGVAAKLEALAVAGANLEFLVARRCADKPGTGVLFVTPVKSPRQTKAAKGAGFRISKSLQGLRIAAADQPGLGVRLTRTLADAGVNLRGASAAAIGRRAVFYLAFDSAADTARAMRCLKKIR
jgi:hypothetical protein